MGSALRCAYNVIIECSDRYEAFSSCTSLVVVDCFGHDGLKCQYPHLDLPSVGPSLSIALSLPTII